MTWPLSQDYNEAIQSPATSFSDAELKTGSVVTNALGLPMPRSGNFADVYEFKCPQRTWAIKCFTRQIPGLRERYKEISNYLKQISFPFIVDFSFLEQGIRIRGTWYPILKMQWVEGFTLNEFVRQQLDKPAVLDQICQIWVKLATRLREVDIAHCDLQHGNVLLVPGRKEASLAVKLVDYDGMCVPALTLLKTIEVGHPNFQHPQRARDGIYSLEVDRFSHLVIYTALRALIASGKPLWDKYDNGDNLLFKQRDFDEPGKSPLFQELAKSSDPGVKVLTQQLLDSLKKPLHQVTPLPELAAKLPPSQVVTAITRSVPAPSKGQSTEELFATATRGSRKRRAKQGGSSMLVAGAAGVVALAALIGGALLFINRMDGEEKPDSVAFVDKDSRKEPIEARKEPVKQKPSEVAVRPNPPPPEQKPPEPNAPPLEVKGGEVELHRFFGHTGAVATVAVSADGTRGLSGGGWPGGSDFTIRLWDLQSGQELKTFRGHTADVTSVAFAPRSNHAVSGGKDMVIRLWDLNTGEVVRRMEGHTGYIHSVAYSANGEQILSAAYDKTIRLWDANTAQEVARLEGHASGIQQAIFSPPTDQVTPGTQRVLSCGWDHSIRLWDLGKREEARRYLGHTDIVHSVAFSPNGKLIVSGGGATGGNGDYGVRLWDRQNGRQLHRLNAHTNLVHSVAFTPDGAHALSASMDGTVRVWDPETGREVQCFRGHTSGVTSIVCLTEGRVLSGSADRSLRLWRIKPEQEVALKPGQSKRTYLSDMQELDARVGYGTFAKKGQLGFEANKMRDIRVGGVAYANGLSLHPPNNGFSNVRYRLDKTAQTLHAEVAINDSSSGPQSALVFEVVGDGKSLWRSQPLQVKNKKIECQADVAQVDMLELRITCLGGSAMAHGVWLDPYVTMGGKESASPVAPLAKNVTNSIDMKLVLVPAGKFLMGTPDAEPNHKANEAPLHEVTISRPFYMGAHEVTVGQFRSFATASGYQTEAERGGGASRLVIDDAKKLTYPQDPKCNWKNPFFEQKDDDPVVCMSWNDTQAFCRWLSQKEGKTYRLPTEAEWEYACRGGTSSPFAFGTSLTQKLANIRLPYQSKEKQDWLQRTMPVGSFPPNPFGIHDMHGNVWEWCNDYGDDDYYQKSPPQDPPGPERGTGRVVRGGSWDNSGSDCRSGFRGLTRSPNYRVHTFGFRVVLVADLKAEPPPPMVAGDVVMVDKELRRFEGHTSPTRALAVTADAQQLLTGSFDNTLRLWNVDTGKEIARLPGHTSPIAQLAMTPDGTRAASVAGSIRVNNGQRENIDTAVRVWDIRERKEILQFDGHKAIVRNVAISADKKLALTCDINRVVKLWELDTGKEIRSFARPGFVQGLAILPDGNRVLFAEGNNLIVWDIKADQEVRRIEHKAPIHSMALSPDGRRVVCGTGAVMVKDGKPAASECSAWLYALDNGQESRRFEHPTPVFCVAFSPGGGHILTSSGGFEFVDKKPVPKDVCARLWDLDSGKELVRLTGHTGPTSHILGVLLTSDGKAITSSMDGTIRLWALPRIDRLIRGPVDPPEGQPAPKVEPAPAAPATRPAAPNADAQQDVERAIREEFKDDFAKSKPAELAGKLLQQANNSGKKPEERFVLARMARDLALKAGDPGLAVRGSELLARDFTVDAGEMKIDALKTLASGVSGLAASRNLLEACLNLVDEAATGDDFDNAAKTLAVAEAVVKKANNVSLSKRLDARARRLRDQQKDFEQVKNAVETLKKTPVDAAACLAVGKYLCLSKGDWDKGLPLLESCSDQTLTALAKREKSSPSDTDAQLDLGDTYWDLSVKETGAGKQQYMRRAYYWYDQAVAGLTGAALTRVDKRMKQATDSMPDLKPAEVTGLIRTFEGHGAEVKCVALSRDGRRALSGGDDGTIHYWDLVNARELQRFDRVGNDLKRLAFSADARRGVAGTGLGFVMQIDLAGRRVERGIALGRDAAVEFLHPTPEGKILAGLAGIAAERDRWLWQLGDDLGNPQLKPLPREYACLATSLDGRMVALGTHEGAVFAYTLEPKLAVLSGPLAASKNKIACLAMSADGRVVASVGAGDRIIRLWDAGQGRALGLCKGHAGKINDLAMSRDGRRLLSVSEDRTARLWDARTGKELSRLEGHSAEVFAAAISSDGRRAVTAGADKTVRLWGLPR